ncbi:MAG: hypothetical protein ACYDCL_00190 [Myxococcales bacterium]
MFRTLGILLMASGSAAAPAASSGPALQCPTCSSWAQPSGQGVGLGVSDFGTATAEEVDVNVLVPFGWLFALRFRPVVYFGLDGSGAAIGGKVEGVFRSKVLWNFVRVYTGGGPAIFYGLTGPNARQVDGNWFAGSINGNWFAGAEIFFHPRWALHWELGTSGGAFDSGAGPYADVGLEAYLF